MLLYADLRMRKEGLDLVLQQPRGGYPAGGNPGTAYLDQPPTY